MYFIGEKVVSLGTVLASLALSSPPLPPLLPSVPPLSSLPPLSSVPPLSSLPLNFLLSSSSTTN